MRPTRTGTRPVSGFTVSSFRFVHPNRHDQADGADPRSAGGWNRCRQEALTVHCGRIKMLPFSECPKCGGEVVERDVEKLLRGGVHVAVVTVRAEVCLRCGERLYSEETIKRFEQIRAKLARQEVEDFQPLGQSFRVVPTTAG